LVFSTNHCNADSIFFSFFTLQSLSDRLGGTNDGFQTQFNVAVAVKTMMNPNVRNGKLSLELSHLVASYYIIDYMLLLLIQHGEIK